MDDVISRQAAIDALADDMPQAYTPDGSHPADEGIFMAQEIYADCIQTLKDLPSAQPDHNADISKKVEGDCISRQAAIDAFHTWFRDGFDEDKWWNSTHVLAAIEGLPSAQQGYKWETCFECPLSHGCPKIKGCTNEQAIEYASQIPNDCPLSAQPNHVADVSKKVADEDCISRQAAIDIFDDYNVSVENGELEAYSRDRKRLCGLPSAQPEPKWIPCSERLPEKMGYYLTSNEYKVVHEDYYWGSGCFEKAKKYQCEVVAWMPMQIPPYYGGNGE